MYELNKKIGKVLTSKSAVTGPSSYEKRIYRAAVSQSLRNTGVLHKCCFINGYFKMLHDTSEITITAYATLEWIQLAQTSIQ